MLIQTHKHTQKDLNMWSEYEEIDVINGYSQKKVDMSVSVIREFLNQNEKSCVMTSWGKDSIVMLDLFIKTGIKKPVVYMKFEDRHNPDCELVKDYFLSKNDIDYHEETYDYNKVRKGDLHWKDLHKKYGKRVTGIRNDESGVRKLQWLVNGFNSKNSCRPLSLWRNKDIFSYAKINSLPLSPVYGYLGGGRWDRAQIRTHSLCGSSGNGMGRNEWEKEYYQDEINKIMNT